MIYHYAIYHINLGTNVKCSEEENFLYKLVLFLKVRDIYCSDLEKSFFVGGSVKVCGSSVWYEHHEFWGHTHLGSNSSSVTD